MNKSSIGGLTVSAFVIGAAITGLAVAVYFLHVSNNTLEEEVQKLRNTRDNLVSQTEAAQAESERLKSEALEHDVWLK